MEQKDNLKRFNKELKKYTGMKNEKQDKKMIKFMGFRAERLA